MSVDRGGPLDAGADVELLHHMVRIPSPSGQEAELAGFLLGAAARLGLRTRLDEVGNLIAETGRGDGPTILLLSHLDTVDDPIPAGWTFQAGWWWSARCRKRCPAPSAPPTCGPRWPNRTR
jgi:hypothetical protein